MAENNEITRAQMLVGIHRQDARLAETLDKAPTDVVRSAWARVCAATGVIGGFPPTALAAEGALRNIRLERSMRVSADPVPDNVRENFYEDGTPKDKKKQVSADGPYDADDLAKSLFDDEDDRKAFVAKLAELRKARGR